MVLNKKYAQRNMFIKQIKSQVTKNLYKNNDYRNEFNTVQAYSESKIKLVQTSLQTN